MNFKKFKHDLQKENLVIPSMSNKVKNYSKQEKVYYQKEVKERKTIFPLFKYATVLVPILIMLLVVTIISVSSNPNNYKYELYSVQDNLDLKKILSVNNEFNINIPGFGGFFNKGDIMVEDAVGPTGSASPDVDYDDFDEPNNSTDDTNNSPDYSETNKQEKNVDEADIVKTDGYNIYYLNYNKQKLFKYNVAKQTLEYIDLYITGEPITTTAQLYIINDYLVMLKEHYSYKQSYQYKVSVVIYNKETLELEKEYTGIGRYVDSRITNNTLYLVYNQRNVQDVPYDIIDSETNTYEYNDIKYSPAAINQGYTFVVAMDLKTLETNVHVQLGANSWEAVYMTENSLYLAASNYCSQLAKYTLIGARFTASSYQTNIFRFDLDGIKVEYSGMVITSGKINDQFYLDEYDGHLRVVLQQQNTIETGNNKLEVYDLSKYQEPGIYDKVASIDEGIGKPGEQIKSVRFSDNSCLIVTFLQTDPLYYIDLSNQLKPQIIGGYEEPGYNTYLHYINENLAIGFGVCGNSFINANDKIVMENHKVGLYDISTGTPNKLDENTQYAYITVVSNHKALYIEGEVFGFAGSYQCYSYNEVGQFVKM